MASLFSVIRRHSHEREGKAGKSVVWGQRGSLKLHRGQLQPVGYGQRPWDRLGGFVADRVASWPTGWPGGRQAACVEPVSAPRLWQEACVRLPKAPSLSLEEEGDASTGCLEHRRG